MAKHENHCNNCELKALSVPFLMFPGANKLAEVKDDNSDVTLAWNECKCGGERGGGGKEGFYCTKSIEILYKTNHLSEHKNYKPENV